MSEKIKRGQKLDNDIMEQIHAAGQEILDEFVRICKENGLTYYLVAGSLLGAVRHKGPIPWDDDIDVAMPRKDLDRFEQLMLEKEHTRPLFHLHSYANDPNFRLFLVRLNKRGTCYSLHHEKNVELRFKELWIDIFPLDDAPVPEDRAFRIAGKKIAVLKRMVNNKVRVNCSGMSLRGKLLHAALSVVPFKLLKKQTEKLMKKWNGKTDACYVGWASHYHFLKQTMPQNWYIPAVKVQYNDKLYNAPGQWDKVLTQLYGNYMELPPPEKRVGHLPEEIQL